VCDGAAQIASTDTSLALSVKHACLLFPDLLKATLTLLTILFADYTVMTCVCGQVEEQVRVNVITNMCLVYLSPNHWRVWMLQQREMRADDAVNVCHSSMNLSNNHLMVAFDPVTLRLVKLVDTLHGLLNYVDISVGMDSGQCNDYSSQYIASLMPEPADYFMLCIHTADCLFKCLDVYNVFDTALQASVAEPLFVSRIDMLVESRYFSLDDIKNECHLPPFEIIGMSLYPEACWTVCGSTGNTTVRTRRNRCFAVIGALINRHSLGLAYYCIPANMSQFVFEYAGQDGGGENSTWGPHQIIEEAFLASLHKLPEGGQDDVLVLTRDRAGAGDAARQTLHLYIAEGVIITLLQTAEHTLESYNYVTDMSNKAFVLNSLERVSCWRRASRSSATCTSSGRRCLSSTWSRSRGAPGDAAHDARVPAQALLAEPG